MDWILAASPVLKQDCRSWSMRDSRPAHSRMSVSPTWRRSASPSSLRHPLGFLRRVATTSVSPGRILPINLVEVVMVFLVSVLYCVVRS